MELRLTFLLPAIAIVFSTAVIAQQKPAAVHPAAKTPTAKPAAKTQEANTSKTNDAKVVVTFKNDSVYKNGVAQFKYNVRLSRTDTASKAITIYSFDHKLEALLTMMSQKDTTRFNARFFSVNKGYNCLYPHIGEETILESYVRNGIIDKKGMTDSLKLAAYLNERKIPIRELPKRSVARPGMDAKRDSIMALRAKERMARQFTFTITNKAGKNVSVFLGDTTAGHSVKEGSIPFRQGRYEVITANEEKSITGFEGEFICITNEKHDLIDTRTLSKQIKHLSIQADGKKLGE